MHSIPFLIVGILLSLYFLRQKAKREGFKEENLIDLLLIGSVFFALFSKIGFLILNPTVYGYYNLTTILEAGFDYNVGFILTLLFFYLYTSKIKKWSFNKLGDIFAKPLAIFISFFSFGLFLEKSSLTRLTVGLIFLLGFFILNYLEKKKLLRLVYFSFIGSSFYFFILGVSTTLLFINLRSYEYFFALLQFLITAYTISLVYKKLKKQNSKMAFSKDFINKLRHRLQRQEKRITQEEINLTKEDPLLVKGRDVGNAEMGDEVEEVLGRGDIDVQRSIYKELKRKVRKALARINLGTYGKCESCGAKIEDARLKANIYATTCIKCSRKVK